MVRCGGCDVVERRWWQWQCGSAAKHPSSLRRCVVHSALGAKPCSARKSDPETGATTPSNSGCRTGVWEDAQPVVTSCVSSYLLAVATAMRETNPPETNEGESVSRLGRKEALQCRHMRAYEDASVDARPAERARAAPPQYSCTSPRCHPGIVEFTDCTGSVITYTTPTTEAQIYAFVCGREPVAASVPAEARGAHATALAIALPTVVPIVLAEPLFAAGSAFIYSTTLCPPPIPPPISTVPLLRATIL